MNKTIFTAACMLALSGCGSAVQTNDIAEPKEVNVANQASVANQAKTDTVAEATDSNQQYHELSIEEKRIEKAQAEIPNVFKPLKHRVADFTQQLEDITSYAALHQLVTTQTNLLWQEGVESFKKRADQDDRPLYWARLQMSKALRQAAAFAAISKAQQRQLLWQFELVSRGQLDVKFDKNTDKKVLMTGFDPFFLDRHIDQSNPSGSNALAFDDKVIIVNGQSVEIETLIVPVRYADFDQGMIETLLTPYFTDQKVDMVTTVSMGRTDFDLERFPGLRRSAKAPDNLNVYTGASAIEPKVPLLHNKPLAGPEFVQFSLPYKAMQQIKGLFLINDNHFVETVAKGKWYPEHLSELADATSVQGSGGGYLSNEISYRSILLRNQYAPTLPVGHIHTPRIKAFDPQIIRAVIEQIERMIGRSISEI